MILVNRLEQNPSAATSDSKWSLTVMPVNLGSTPAETASAVILKIGLPPSPTSFSNLRVISPALMVGMKNSQAGGSQRTS